MGEETVTQVPTVEVPKNPFSPKAEPLLLEDLNRMKAIDQAFYDAYEALKTQCVIPSRQFSSCKTMLENAHAWALKSVTDL